MTLPRDIDAAETMNEVKALLPSLPGIIQLDKVSPLVSGRRWTWLGGRCPMPGTMCTLCGGGRNNYGGPLNKKGGRPYFISSRVCSNSP